MTLLEALGASIFLSILVVEKLKKVAYIAFMEVEILFGSLLKATKYNFESV